ncbi:Putative ubiquitin system component CUE [Septoria linicola]|uniref:Coupling of ubiquitin conjugation to ER degradation protein 1 n=1 Tax=Septoria linicola TaxID=215465 RepID=A0A9Q9EKW4_9PEZI|nr:putative ubiquitin system component CUE [Septoria linicola]USW54480.1 Putative ubiquitin system component CUE [Septoria linicola]
MAVDTQNSINIPQIVAVVVVGFLAIRWYMSKPATPGNSSGSSGSSSRNRIDPAKVDAVSAVFPQLDRRSIAWDLQRNGGNVEATTARVLDGRGLDNPPPTFQPRLPTPTLVPTTTTASGRQNVAVSQQDLISRYGLQGRLESSGKGKEPVLSEEQERQRRKSAWSSDKAQRAETLKRRREEMILAARRKMAEKDAAA